MPNIFIHKCLFPLKRKQKLCMAILGRIFEVRKPENGTIIGYTLWEHYLSEASFPGSSVSKESACSAGDSALIPGSGRSPGEGNGKPLHYACLENPMDRGAWWAAGHGITESHLSVQKCLDKSKWKELYLMVPFSGVSLPNVHHCQNIWNYSKEWL